jgi:hypothetical protein
MLCRARSEADMVAIVYDLQLTPGKLQSAIVDGNKRAF